MSRNGSATQREAVEQQAADYVLALADHPLDGTRREIDRWLAASPAHAVAFAKAERAWEVAGRLKRADFPSPDLPLPALSPPLLLPDGHDVLPGVRFARRHVLGYGVAALAASVASGLLGLRWLTGRRRIATAVGQVRNFSLADGTRLHLNTDTEALVTISATRRLVTLTRGEAYFDVAHDPAAPFDVEAGGARVRVLGTAFNLRLGDASVELTVTQGLVGVRSADGASENVPAGEAAIIRRYSVAVSSLAVNELDQRTAWRNGVVEFDGQPLAQAISEFNRYRERPIRIGDPRIAALRVGGRFQLDQADEFLSALRLTLPIQTITDADGSVLLLYRPSEGGEDMAAAGGADDQASPDTGPRT